MTPLLKQLMTNYGRLYITLVELERERPGTEHATLADYYRSLGPTHPDEPVLAVRISKDGETRFLHGTEAAAMRLPEDYNHGKVTVLELPEDEFYFFQSFRQTAFDLESALPPFLFTMAYVYAHTMFESYVGDLIRLRLSERDAARLMREPLRAIPERLRYQHGFADLTAEFDSDLVILSLTRNCLVHNGGRADARLATAQPFFSPGDAVAVDLNKLTAAINVYRGLAVALDAFADATQT